MALVDIICVGYNKHQMSFLSIRLFDIDFIQRLNASTFLHYALTCTECPYSTDHSCPGGLYGGSNNLICNQSVFYIKRSPCEPSLPELWIGPARLETASANLQLCNSGTQVKVDRAYHYTLLFRDYSWNRSRAAIARE